MSDKTYIDIKILNTEDVIFEGRVDRISSFNEVGAFDIFPMHANFISIIGEKITLYKDHQKIKELEFEQAVLKVKKDIVYIFLGIEVLFIDDEHLDGTQKSSGKK